MLNGWQRIGILLSFIWCITVTSFLAYEYYDVRTTSPPVKVEYKESVNTDKSLNTNAQSEFDFSEAVAKRQELNRLRAIKHRQDILNFNGTFKRFLIFTFLPIISSWLFIYTCVLSIQWVKRGFNDT